jgi:hypothetical protein
VIQHDVLEQREKRRGEALHLAGLVAALCEGAGEGAARGRRRAWHGGSALPTVQD